MELFLGERCFRRGFLSWIGFRVLGGRVFGLSGGFLGFLERF